MRQLWDWMNRSENAAALAVATNGITLVVELIVGLVVGSVAIIADALHGGVDFFTSVMAFISIRLANRPPDPAHPFGHGKLENVSGTVEAVIIMGGAGFVFYQGAQALTKGHVLTSLEMGIGVVIVVAFLKLLVSQHMLRVARRERSIALEADAQHVRADVLTSAGAAGGLVAIRLTGLNILDPLVAIGISLLIVRAGLHVLREAFGGLIDSSLSDDEVRTIEESIRTLGGEVCGYHRIRSRRAGRERLVDLHLVMPQDVTVAQAHEVIGRLEQSIESRMTMTDVTIHLEPCDMDPAECAAIRDRGGHLEEPAQRGVHS